MEDLEDLWEKLSLTDKEGGGTRGGVDLVESSQRSEYILVAKFLTPRVLNTKFVARTFKLLWKT